MKSENKNGKRVQALTGVAVMIGAAGGIFGLASGAAAGTEEPDTQNIGHVWVYEVCADSDSYEGAEGILVRMSERTSGVQYDSFDVVDPDDDSETYDLNPLWESKNSQWSTLEFFIPISTDGEDPIYGDYEILFDGSIKHDNGSGSQVVEELTVDLNCGDGGDDTYDFEWNFNFTLAAPAAAETLPKTGSDSNTLAILAPTMILLGGGLMMVRRRLVNA